jgi:hypothetical protein
LLPMPRSKDDIGAFENFRTWLNAETNGYRFTARQSASESDRWFERHLLKTGDKNFEPIIFKRWYGVTGPFTNLSVLFAAAVSSTMSTAFGAETRARWRCPGLMVTARCIIRMQPPKWYATHQMRFRLTTCCEWR